MPYIFLNPTFLRAVSFIAVRTSDHPVHAILQQEMERQE